MTLALVVGTAAACPYDDAEARAACAAYIACTEHYASTFGVDAPDTSEYEDDATCFTDPDVAPVCEAQCRDGRDALADALRAANEPEGPCG